MWILSGVLEHIVIRWGYKNEAKWGKQDYISFLGTATFSEAMKQTVDVGCTCGCHTRYDKHRRSQRLRSSYHNIQLQWVIAVSYRFHKHSNWYCYRHYYWYISTYIGVNVKMFWTLIKKKHFDCELVDLALICRDLYQFRQHRWIGGPDANIENSQCLQSGS